MRKLEDDFQHFLTYSGLYDETPEITQKMRLAFYASGDYPEADYPGKQHPLGLIAQTLVWHKGTRFIVSTTNRESSQTPGKFHAETLVWRTEDGGRELVHQDGAPVNSIAKHQYLVECFRSDGEVREEEHELCREHAALGVGA